MRLKKNIRPAGLTDENFLPGGRGCVVLQGERDAVFLLDAAEQALCKPFGKHCPALPDNGELPQRDIAQKPFLHVCPTPF